MATAPTKNYFFMKAARTDAYSVDLVNDNLDKIDEKISVVSKKNEEQDKNIRGLDLRIDNTDKTIAGRVEPAIRVLQSGVKELTTLTEALSKELDGSNKKFHELNQELTATLETLKSLTGVSL